MTDDSLPNTDAARAREGMVDELKTINKYEEMADAAENPDVADTLREVADDERVHVGNFGALVAMEDPKAVPKMMEGIEETEKDTGIVIKRSKSIDQLIQKNLDDKFFESCGDSTFKKAREKLPEGWVYDDEGNIVPVEGVLDPESIEETYDKIVDMIDENAKIMGELHSQIMGMINVNQKMDVDELVDDLAHTQNLNFIDAILKTVDPNSIPYVKDNLRAAEGFNKMDRKVQTYILKALDRARSQNSKIIAQYERLRKANAVLEGLRTQVENEMGDQNPTEDNSLAAQIGAARDEADAIKAELQKFNPIEIGEAIASARTPAGIKVEFETPHDAAMAFLENPARYIWGFNEDAPITAALVDAVTRYKAAARQELALSKRRNEVKAEARRKKAKVGVPEDERIKEYLDNLEALKVDIEGKQDEIEENAREIADLYGIPIDEAIRAETERPYMQLASKYPDVIDYLQLQADKDYANIGMELRKRLVENGVFDERNWARWAKDGETYRALNGYIHNPYEYDMDENVIDEYINKMQKPPEKNGTPRGGYALSSRRWLQGISDALWNGKYPRLVKFEETPASLKEVDRFPSYTLFSKHKKELGIDAFGALRKLGVTNVGQLREFVALWTKVANEIRSTWPVNSEGKKVPPQGWPQANKEVKEKAIEEWSKSKGLDLTEDDLSYLTANLIGLGYASTNSQLAKLGKQIKSLPDDMTLDPAPLTHPELTKDKRGDYEAWIQDNFIKTEPYVYEVVFKPLYGLIKDTYDRLSNENPEVRKRELAAFATAMTNFIENSVIDGNNVGYILKDSPIGAQLVEFVSNMANKMMPAAQSEEDRQLWELVSGLGDNLKERLIRKVYGSAFASQYDDRWDEAADIARENYGRVAALLGAAANLPPVVGNALQDMKRKFDILLGNEEAENRQEEYAAVDKVLGKNFEMYGQDLLDGLEGYVGDDGGIDSTAYSMHEILPESIEKLAGAIVGNWKLSQSYADAVKEIDPELATFLQSNEVNHAEFRKDVLDTLPAVIGKYPHTIRQWLSDFGDNPGPKTHMIDHAAELYLIGGSEGESGQKLGGSLTGSMIDAGSGGTGKQASESARLYDEAKGINTNPIKGYDTPKKDEDQDKEDIITSNDEYVKRRMSAVSDTLKRVDDPLIGVPLWVAKGDSLDNGTMLTPKDVGYDEDKLKSEMSKDPEGTINDILSKMHARGAITRMDFTDDELTQVLPELILGVKSGDSWDISGSVPVSDDLVARYDSTKDTIRSEKEAAEASMRSPEDVQRDEALEEDIEKKKAYEAQVENLNHAEMLEMAADELEKKPIKGLKGKYADVSVKDSSKARAEEMAAIREDMADRDKILDVARRQLKDRVAIDDKNSLLAEEARERRNKILEERGTPELAYHKPAEAVAKDKERRDMMVDAAEGAVDPTEKIGVAEYDAVVDAINIPQKAHDRIKELVEKKEAEDIRTNPPEITQEAIESVEAHNKKLRQERETNISDKRELARIIRDSALNSGVEFKTDDPTYSPEFREKYREIVDSGDADYDESRRRTLMGDTSILRSASSQKEKRPPLRVTHVFSQAIPFYGIKLDLNDNEPFDAAKYRTVKKEVQGSKRTNIDSLIAGHQKQ